MAGEVNGSGDRAQRRGARDARVRDARVRDARVRDARVRDRERDRSRKRAPAEEPARELLVSFAPGTGSDERPALIRVDSGRATAVDEDGRRASIVLGDPPSPRLTTDAGSHTLLVVPLPDVRRAAAGVQRLEVVIDGWRFELDVESAARARLRERATSGRAVDGHGGPSEVRAIIPGRVISVDVADGDAVEAGGRLLVLEAMKMQNEVRAPRGGRVAGVAVGRGQTVELGDVLLVIE
jgi:biotin carboxyl carrier protein